MIAGSPIGKYALAALAAAVFTLSGCDSLFTSDSAVAKPPQLHPETDAFSVSATRLFTWTEGMTAGGQDYTLRQFNLNAIRTGVTSSHDTLFLNLSLSAPGQVLPGSVVSGLGFNAALVKADTTAVPDPGPALAFPSIPQAGWRGEWTVGDLRFVRRLTGSDVQKQGVKSVECWVFAESTYVAGQPISSGTAWVGYQGLVRHRTEWPSYQPSTNAAATLWREIQAQ